MDIQVAAAGADEQSRLAALLELYVYDFSEMLGLDVEEDGRFRLPAIDSYWTEAEHHPFLIRVDAKLAGFALVKERRHGVGGRAAGLLFDRFPGPWELRQRPENHDATAFWRRAIAHYTGGQFEDATWNDERWRGPVQRFDSSR